MKKCSKVVLFVLLAVFMVLPVKASVFAAGSGYIGEQYDSFFVNSDTKVYKWIGSKRELLGTVARGNSIQKVQSDGNDVSFIFADTEVWISGSNLIPLDKPNIRACDQNWDCKYYYVNIIHYSNRSHMAVYSKPGNNYEDYIEEIEDRQVVKLESITDNWAYVLYDFNAKKYGYVNIFALASMENILEEGAIVPERNSYLYYDMADEIAVNKGEKAEIGNNYKNAISAYLYKKTDNNRWLLCDKNENLLCSQWGEDVYFETAPVNETSTYKIRVYSPDKKYIESKEVRVCYYPVIPKTETKNIECNLGETRNLILEMPKISICEHEAEAVFRWYYRKDSKASWENVTVEGVNYALKDHNLDILDIDSDDAGFYKCCVKIHGKELDIAEYNVSTNGTVPEDRNKLLFFNLRYTEPKYGDAVITKDDIIISDTVGYRVKSVSNYKSERGQHSPISTYGYENNVLEIVLETKDSGTEFLYYEEPTPYGSGTWKVIDGCVNSKLVEAKPNNASGPCNEIVITSNFNFERPKDLFEIDKTVWTFYQDVYGEVTPKMNFECLCGEHNLSFYKEYSLSFCDIKFYDTKYSKDLPEGLQLSDDRKTVFGTPSKTGEYEYLINWNGIYTSITINVLPCPHSYKVVKNVAATYEKDGESVYECEICHERKSFTNAKLPRLDIEKFCIAKIDNESLIYNGQNQIPNVSVTFGDKLLTAAADYQVTLPEVSTVPGEYKITVKGINGYSGETSIKYSIKENDISANGSVVLTKTEFNYNGLNQVPDVSVKVGDKLLTAAADYQVTLPEASIVPGEYKVTVKGINGYSGEVSVAYTIKENVLGDNCNAVLAKTEYVYSKKAFKPSVTVTNADGTILKSGTDYKVTYQSGRKDVGTYKVTVKGIGYTKGSSVLTFTVKPPKTKVSKVSAGKKAFTVKWSKKTTQVTGYQIAYGTAKDVNKAKKVLVKSNGTTSKTIKSLKAKKKYYVWVRTYKTVKGKKIYGDWTAVKSVTTKK